MSTLDPTLPFWALLLVAVPTGLLGGVLLRLLYDATWARARSARATLANLTRRARGGV